MKEIWKDIVGYEGLYQVSDMGRVKSKRRVLKQSKPTQKYKYKKVSLSKYGVVKSVPVHKIVAIAFLNHVPNGMVEVIDHLDGDRTNNSLSNLTTTTQRNNLQRKGGSSNYAGVRWHKKYKKWYSQIKINNKSIHLGCFSDEKDANKAYKDALKNIEN